MLSEKWRFAGADMEYKIVNGCPVCGDSAARIRKNKNGRLYVSCPGCGPINVHSEHAQEALQKLVVKPEKPAEQGSVPEKVKSPPAESAGGGLFW